MTDGLALARKLYSGLTQLRIRSERALGIYAGHAVRSDAGGNQLIADALRSGRSFMAGRLGFHELDAISGAAGVRAEQAGGLTRWRSRVRAEPARFDAELLRCLQHIAGFFPAEPAAVQRLADTLVDAIEAADILAIWYRRYEDELMRRHAPAAIPILPRGLEPYYHAEPWSQQLASRRVLVVHPYEDSIRRQYAKRHLLFADRAVWPDCELLTLKAVQTLAGEPSAFPDWFAALEHMKRGIDALDFDVAIIGAGAYGFPLAAHVKRSGRSAIHIGGATQLLFGIAGKRWEDRPEVMALVNEHWVRPAPQETPRAHQSIEGGAYW